MSKIQLGKSDSGPVSIDLDLLLAGRALVQAGSGGGKSWALRRISEQAFGKVPVWILDPEGEFASLREKYGFVLVGKGGETPADPRSIQLVVHKLLELRASVIFDIFELKPEVRQHFVRLLLEALVDAPKHLWQALLLIIDEAHKFAPESGKAEAYSAMVDIATRGRKRGFSVVPATQRLASLSKNVTANLLNRLVGPTFEDVDLERAADLLSVIRSDRAKFFEEMRVLEPGHFHAIGRAFGPHRLIVNVGPVETTHPELGQSKYSAAPPPAPDKIKALLPKLQDLPKEAEQKAKTEAELRAEIRSLKAQIAQSGRKDLSTNPGKVNQPLPKPVRVEVPVVPAAQLVRIERAMANAITAAGKCDNIAVMLRAFSDLIQANVKKIEQRARRPEPVLTPIPAHGVHLRPQPTPPEVAIRNERCYPKPTENPGGLKPAHLKILRALAEFEALGKEPARSWVAARAGASHKSSAYSNNLGTLRTSGLIEYGPGTLRLTDQGRQVAPAIGTLNTTEMLASCLKVISPAQGRILSALHFAHPEAMTREELAQKSEASATSSAFANNLGALRSAGMVEYCPNSTVKAADWLFID